MHFPYSTRVILEKAKQLKSFSILKLFGGCHNTPNSNSLPWPACPPFPPVLSPPIDLLSVCLSSLTLLHSGNMPNLFLRQGLCTCCSLCLTQSFPKYPLDPWVTLSHHSSLFTNRTSSKRSSSSYPMQHVPCPLCHYLPTSPVYFSQL